MKKITDRFEYEANEEIFHDFCLWEYKPVVPYENKFKSSNILFQTFDITCTDNRIFDIIQAIREGIGISRTVWGVKQMGNILNWEFYFYDYRRTDRERSITKLLNSIKPFTNCDLKINENLFYFMFSIDIDDDLISGTKDLNEVHMYIGNPGSEVSSGICYSLTENNPRLENFYFFFDSKKHRDDILSKTVCSSYIDFSIINIDQVIWPELKECKVIVVANKQMNDAVYFSGINVDQLIFFLKKLNYPEKLVSFVETNRFMLDHLQYDVGFDYRMKGNELDIIKSGFYGIF
jgi:hypothetical protein